jgi:N-acetylmuramoyl-L-alanine amidase
LIILTALALLGYILGSGPGNRQTFDFAALNSASSGPERVVVVDAGHGGMDGGAISPNGHLESAYNLEIALRTELFLRFLGTPVAMTRTEDVSLHDDSAGTVRQKKISDLRNRAALVNSLDGAVLLSIHQNHFPDPRYFGAQVFYNDRPESKALAEAMQEALRGALDPNNRRQPKTVDALLMNEAQGTAILVECGFLSHAAEEALLRDPAYQIKLAIVMSITVTDWVVSTENKTND